MKRKAKKKPTKRRKRITAEDAVLAAGYARLAAMERENAELRRRQRGY